jgi:carboxylesterase
MTMHRFARPEPASTAPGAVLLLHGLCANPLELQPVAKALRKGGWVVDSPLIHGCGIDAQTLQQGRVPTRTYEDWLDQAEAAYLRLAQQHGAVGLGGLCMGAVLALALAARLQARHPTLQARALLLMSPTLYFDGWNVSPWRRLLPLAYLPGLRGRLSFAETSPYGLKNERLRLWIEQAMQADGVCAVGAARLPADRLYQASRLMRHVKTVLPQVDVPTQILHATQDDVASPRTVHLLERRLGRRPAVRWFHDSYHMLTLDNEREAVCAAATSFIAAQLPVRRSSVPLRQPDEAPALHALAAA